MLCLRTILEIIFTPAERPNDLPVSPINQSANEKLLLYLYGHFYSQASDLFTFRLSILKWKQQSIEFR